MASSANSIRSPVLSRCNNEATHSRTPCDTSKPRSRSKACSWFVSSGPPTVGICKSLISASDSSCSSRDAFQNRSFSGRFYCTERALWKLNWFLRDFGYDQQLLADDQVDEKALVNLRGVVRTSHVTLMGRTYQNLEAFAPAADWDELTSDVTQRQSQESSHGV